MKLDPCSYRSVVSLQSCRDSVLSDLIVHEASMHLRVANRQPKLQMFALLGHNHPRRPTARLINITSLTGLFALLWPSRAVFTIQQPSTSLRLRTRLSCASAESLSHHSSTRRYRLRQHYVYLRRSRGGQVGGIRARGSCAVPGRRDRVLVVRVRWRTIAATTLMRCRRMYILRFLLRYLDSVANIW